MAATEKALRTASGMMRGSWTGAFHLVIGLNISTTSMYWWVSLCMPESSTCPVRATMGALSSVASAMPVARLVAPGPSVARQTPGLPVRRP